MAGVIGCPACGGKFRLPADAKAGMMIRCPHCSRAIQISGPPRPAGGGAASSSRSAATLPPDLLSDLPDPLAAPADPLGPPRRKGPDRTALYVVAGVSGGLVLILMVALILALSGGREPASGPGESAVAAAAPADAAAEESPKPQAVTPEAPVAQRPPAVASEPQSPGRTAEPEPREPEKAEPPAAPVDDIPDNSTQLSENDLLGRIDPVRDALGGTWTREGRNLVCPGGSRWALVMPEPPPDGYRWTLAVERVSGYGAVSLGIVVGGHLTMVVLEGYGSQSSGLNRLDGRQGDNNETTWRGPIFHEGRPTTVVCTVGLSRVQVVCDGKTIIDWSGSPQRLSFDRSSWQDLPGDRLIVVSYQGVNVRISKIELEEVDAGEPAPPEPSPNYAQSRPGRFGGGRPPGWPMRPFFGPSAPPSEPSPPPSQPSPPQPSRDEETASPAPAQPPPMIPPEELPEPVARSKESVCIIEHPLGSGTGFVVAENLIATNAHVVDGAYVEEIECHFSAGGVLKCRASRVLYEDAVRDLCLLEVKTEQAPIAIKADHGFTRGEKVVIVGNPALGETSFVLRDAVARGTITAVVHTDKCDFYQIDATVNFGSSGGPVLNLDGEVIGVIAMKATERGESELRTALQSLDQDFAARFGGTVHKGIAFGIPVNALSHAIQQVQTQSEAAAAQVGQRHTAQVLLERLSFLGGFYLIQMQVNVPSGIRQQASKIDLSHLSPAARNKINLVPLLPEYLARPLARELNGEEVQKMVRSCSAGIEGRVRDLGRSEHFDQTIARGLESLLRCVLKTKGHLEKPPITYQAFSQAVNEQKDELKALIGRLEDQLEVSEAAYED